MRKLAHVIVLLINGMGTSSITSLVSRRNNTTQVPLAISQNVTEKAIRNFRGEYSQN